MRADSPARSGAPSRCAARPLEIRATLLMLPLARPCAFPRDPGDLLPLVIRAVQHLAASPRDFDRVRRLVRRRHGRPRRRWHDVPRRDRQRRLGDRHRHRRHRHRLPLRAVGGSLVTMRPRRASARPWPDCRSLARWSRRGACRCAQGPVRRQSIGTARANSDIAEFGWRLDGAARARRAPYTYLYYECFNSRRP